MCGWMCFYASQFSLFLRVSQSSPKTVPKPQQERGFAVGENRSNGKRMSSKPLQGSLFVAFAVQRSGTHLPREFTMILTVRNSFTMVNRPMVTLTAMGAPRAASPLLREVSQSQSQPQELQELQVLQQGNRSSASSATALPSAMMNGPPLDAAFSNWSVTVVTSASVEACIYAKRKNERKTRIKNLLSQERYSPVLFNLIGGYLFL